MSIKKRGMAAFAAFFLIALAAPKSPCRISAEELAADRLIRVNILSKPLRLLQEGKIDPVRLSFPEGARVEEPRGSIGPPIREARIEPLPGGWGLSTDIVGFKGQFSLVMDTSGPDRSFEARVGNELRRYPLPLTIRAGAGKIELVVTESLSRYALDAARAEYGPVPPHSEEALDALALLIAVRLKGPRRAHEGFDACDLAHCVVYRGLAGPADAHAHAWRIDPGSLPCGAHFHAGCGGRTLGEHVFGRAGAPCGGVSDRLVETATALCGPGDWRARIGAAELPPILSIRDTTQKAGVTLQIDEPSRRVDIRYGGSLYSFAAEDFRLRVNRRKGWNFLKSNDYIVETSSEANEKAFVFTGRGSGHGAGLCQHGALELARLGFSRYEILAHYYPGIRFERGDARVSVSPPEVSYVLFDTASGAITEASHPAFEHRKLPAGSIFKLFVALHCAVERPDLFDAYRYRCAGRAGPPLPERCWTPEGHGETGMEGALANSCNLFFASLHSEIGMASLRRFCASLVKAGIRVELPPVSGPDEFARLLAGLDYRVRFSVRDAIALARLVYPDAPPNPALRLSGERRDIIARALFQTMISGTAGNDMAKRPADANAAPWGKTATVLSGSNRLAGYGLFLGGAGDRAVFVALRGGTGARAAQAALGILGRTKGALSEKK